MVVMAKPVLPPDEVDVFRGEVRDGADAAVEGGRADRARCRSVQNLALGEADAGVDVAEHEEEVGLGSVWALLGPDGVEVVADLLPDDVELRGVETSHRLHLRLSALVPALALRLATHRERAERLVVVGLATASLAACNARPPYLIMRLLREDRSEQFDRAHQEKQGGAWLGLGERGVGT